VEADPKFNGSSLRDASAAALAITDRADAEVTYNLMLLIEAGSVAGNAERASSGKVVISRLTWEGHEFLDDIRDPEIWHKTKERGKAVAGVGVNFIWEIAKAEIKAKLGLL